MDTKISKEKVIRLLRTKHKYTGKWSIDIFPSTEEMRVSYEGEKCGYLVFHLGEISLARDDEEISDIIARKIVPFLKSREEFIMEKIKQ